MHEGLKSRAVERILDPDASAEKTFTKKRQHTAQASPSTWNGEMAGEQEALPGRITGYRWADDGHVERLDLLFGDRVIEIEGHNLGPLVEEIREGKLNSIREMSSSKQMLLSQTPGLEPVISTILSYPELDDIVREIKGENDNGDKAGHARRIQR